METTGSASCSEARRRLAVARLNEGWAQKDVAAFLGVSTRAVGKWMAAYRESGEDGLKARPRPGAKPKLSQRQEQAVLTWIARSPRAFGYPDDLWTTRRLAEVVERKYKVRFNSNYLAEWLTRRGYTPQRPEVRAVERDEPAIARWIAEDWPRLQKERGTSRRTSS
jgi:transposase